MEFWLSTRHYVVVAPEDIKIENFEVPPHDDDAMQPLSNGIDKNVPHIIQWCCKNTVSVRVIAKKNADQTSKQMFLMIRNNLSSTFAKKDIVELCNMFLLRANCILIANRILTQSHQEIHRKSLMFGNSIEMLLLSDLAFDKRKFRKRLSYRVLTKAEVEALETKKKLKITDLPHILISDPIVKYHGFHIGNVLESLEPDIQYRIVTSNSGSVPLPKTDETLSQSTSS